MMHVLCTIRRHLRAIWRSVRQHWRTRRIDRAMRYTSVATSPVVHAAEAWVEECAREIAG